MAYVQEVFSPKRMAASGALFGASGGSLGGFMCTTAGNVRVCTGADNSGTDVVSTFAVTVGNFYALPFALSGAHYAELTGGAVGTFAIL